MLDLFQSCLIFYPRKGSLNWGWKCWRWTRVKTLLKLYRFLMRFWSNFAPLSAKSWFEIQIYPNTFWSRENRFGNPWLRAPRFRSSFNLSQDFKHIKLWIIIDFFLRPCQSCCWILGIESSFLKRRQEQSKQLLWVIRQQAEIYCKSCYSGRLPNLALIEQQKTLHPKNWVKSMGSCLNFRYDWNFGVLYFEILKHGNTLRTLYLKIGGNWQAVVQLFWSNFALWTFFRSMFCLSWA